MDDSVHRNMLDRRDVVNEYYENLLVWYKRRNTMAIARRIDSLCTPF